MTEAFELCILLFASARDAVGGVSTVKCTLPGGSEATTTALREVLASSYPNLRPLVMDEDTITLAVNQEYVPSDEVLVLKPGDEVALIPPISGG
eukprot:CAMPEP_0194266700 /NCGR_PEP_ID=MMETSP0169-20130528/1523_1 /TAXON_ID=218684 /ORGANISM="Corethron pennatum, Strain L29A3" /LENGTH=93 /DNA_ID=CAMNT_0039007445 /DNA_START=151 /DNA_END=432 /DNA_ORIENTATION=+